MNTVNRRDILGRLAVASAVGALTVPAVAHAAAHPDAELLQAGRRWQAAGRTWLQHPDEDVSEAARVEFERLNDRITGLQAHTATGVAVSLRVALLHTDLMGEAEEGILCGGPCSAEMFENESQRMLWRAIATLEQLDRRVAA